MRSANMAENTISSYRKDVRQFLDFITSKDIDIPAVDHGVILQFLEHLTQRKLASSTKRRKLEAVKTFYNAMCRLDGLARTP